MTINENMIYAVKILSKPGKIKNDTIYIAKPEYWNRKFYR